MSAAKWVTHAHTEPVRKQEAAGALTNAEQHIRKMVAATNRDRIAKAAGADRVAAKLPASTLNENEFVAVATMQGGSDPRAVDHLESHGVMVGIKNGVMSIQRRYVPTATGLLSQLAGGR